MTTTSIMVRDHNNPSVVATTGSFTVAPAPSETMTIRTPLGVVVGVQTVLAGTYANGTITAIDYSTDAGATWFPIGSPAISGGSWSGSGPTYSATNAAVQILVRDHGNQTVTATTAQFSVVAAPSGGAVFNQPFTLNNPANQATQVNPFFSFGIPAAAGDIPATGYKPAVYDATGTTHIADLQFDQVASGWLDSSANLGVVSGFQNGLTLNPGTTTSFTIKWVPGTADPTPCFTLAQLAARTNIKAVCKIGADTYTVSVNTIISKYNYGATRPSYPVGFIEQWKYGPNICEWDFAQFLIRDSDGAQHRWLMLKLYISMLSTGDFYFVIRVENAMAYGPHPSGTIGPTPLAGVLTIDSIDIMNGTTRIGAGGGPNDKRAGSFAPSAVSTASGSITCQFGAGFGVNNAFYSSIGFTSTGKLPGGITASDTYWVLSHGAGVLVPMISRQWLAKAARGIIKLVQLFQAGLVTTLSNYVYANGSFYACTKAGTSAGVLPSGTTSNDGTVVWTKMAGGPGPTQFPVYSAGMPLTTTYYILTNSSYYAVTTNGTAAGNTPTGSSATFTDGTITWTRISAALTDQGTGTHTVYPKVSVSQWSKADIMDTDSWPQWSGAGPMPKLLPGYPVSYITQKAKAIPPIDQSIIPTLAPWLGVVPTYYWNVIYMPGHSTFDSFNFYIGDVGESVVDERINLFSPTSFANILMPNDYGMAVSMRYIALSYVDRIYYPRDERAQQQVVGSYGPDRLGGSYPGMAPSNPTAQQQNNGGNPKITSVRVDSMNWPGYGGSVGDSGSWDASHSPNPFYWVYIHSGHPMFLDAAMEHSNGQFLGFGAPGSPQASRSATLNGKTYSWAFTSGLQARGYGHQFKAMWQTEWSIPSNHPAKPYFSDRMDDTANQFMNWIKATQTPAAQALGWIPTVYNTFGVTGAQDVEPWMTGYYVENLGMVCLINTRPGFADILNYQAKFWLRLFDSDVNGTEKGLDAQYLFIGSGAPSYNGPTFAPTDTQLITDPHHQLADPMGLDGIMQTTWPPPGNYFWKGLPQQQSHYAFVYWTTPISANAYLASNRSALIVGEMAGFTDFGKVRKRVDTLIQSSGIPIQFVAPTTQVSWGNRNGLMYAFAPF